MKSQSKVSEAIVANILYQKGYDIAKNWIDDKGWDLMVRRGGGWEKIQVKSSDFAKGSTQIFTHSRVTSFKYREGGVGISYADMGIHWFAIHNTSNNEVYFVHRNYWKKLKTFLIRSTPFKKISGKRSTTLLTINIREEN